MPHGRQYIKTPGASNYFQFSRTNEILIQCKTSAVLEDFEMNHHVRDVNYCSGNGSFFHKLHVVNVLMNRRRSLSLVSVGITHIA